jgi:hypothetical protein
MLSALLAGLLIAVASLLLGAAIMVAAGRPRHSAVGPAAGLSALLVICGIAVKLPGHGITAAIAAGLVLLGSVVVLERSRVPFGSIRIGAVAAVVGAALVIAIPFAANGRIGILGQGLVNDDMASHLHFAEWVDSREGPTPDLVEDGYPLGPHAVVSAASKVTGADLVEAFAGLTGALAVLAALTAYGALRGVREPLRAGGAVLAAAPYLSAAYFAQGAFKEPMLALALLAFALSLPALRGNWSWRAGIPAGVIAAGTIYNYSFPGLAWLFGTAVIWALILAYRERGERGGLDLGRRLRSARPALVAAAAIAAITALPEVVNLARFASFEAFSPSGEGGNTGFGNLRQPLNPLEALGIWPSAEFRITPARASTPAAAFWLGGLLALVAAGWGLGRALARREAALPAAVAAGALGYLGAVAAGTPYTSAKALAIAAPVVMVLALRGLLSADSLEGEEEPGAASSASRPGAAEAAWWPPAPVRPFVRFGVPLLAVAFIGAAAISSLLPLRQAAVGPTENAEAVMEMRDLVDGEDVLFLGRDNFISWELLGAEVYAPIINHYDTEEVPSLYRATPTNAKFDWDNVPLEVLDGLPLEGIEDYEPRRFDWVVTTSAAMQSEAPPNFERALETGDFVLWRRTGPSPPRRTLVEELDPGALLECPSGSLPGASGSATTLPQAPVVSEEWSPKAEPTDGKPARLLLTLGRGRWEISLQYASTQDIQVSGVGPEPITLPANLLFRGPSPFYRVGSIDLQLPPGSAPDATAETEITVTVDRPSGVGRLLGTDSKAYLDRIAATPAQPARESSQLGDACGRYVDWYRADPSTPPETLAGLPAPEVRPPDK